MNDDRLDYVANLLRLLVAEAHSLVALTLSVQLFGKNYLELTDAERYELETKAAKMRLQYTSHLTEDGARKMLEVVLPDPPKSVQ